MKLRRGFDSIEEFRGGFLSIGNFDGVHRGHQQMMTSLVRHARRQDVPACVFTFDPHPIRLLRPEHCPPALTSLDQKIRLIEQCGVDGLVVYPTDRELLNLSPEEFFQSVVRHQFDAVGMVEGPNFCFGRNRSGTVDDLQKYCRQEGLELEIVPPVFVGTRMVSSTAIRRLILAGDVEQANELLGHPCEIIGRVSKGAGRGRLIGFPTANVTDTVTVMPRDGVYAGVARIPGETAEACQTGETEPTRGTGPNEEHFWPAAINIGPNPTFGEHGRKLEVHLIGFAGDLYGCRLQIEFVARLRETRQFPDAEALQTQLEQDITQARAVVSRVLTR